MPSQFPVMIRDPVQNDEEAWRNLWMGYNSFYDASIPSEVTNRTWQRIFDSASPIFARFATANNEVIGFSISVLHEGTWTITPICYLEDLFVDPNRRGCGVGRLLIEDLIDCAQLKGWSRLYWHTRANNTARSLFDNFTKADDFVRYRILLG